MSVSNVANFLKSLNMRAKRETEKGIAVFYSTTVINNNKSLKVIEKEPIKTLNNRINNLVKMEEPEIIKVDLFIEGDKWLEGNVCDLRSKEGNTPTTNFQGLGEVEINAIVEKRFDEKKREYEYLEMTEAVKELSDENDELKERIEDLEKQNNELLQSLEQKKQIRYYAGMLGDILESIGIRKEKLSKPIAELMGIDEKPEQRQIAGRTDNSGIVEETAFQQPNTGTPMTTDEQKRFEIISLISQFLNSVDNQLLGELFTIFSEIETNRTLAPEILEYIQKKKDFAS
jgi:hypothetical protein